MRFFPHLVIILAIFTSSAADPVLNLIEQGKNAYQQQEYRRAHDLLQEALSEINKKLSASFEPFLPQAPKGWTAQEADTRSLSFSATDGNVRVTEAEQEFITDDGNNKVHVTITNTPQILTPYKQIAKAMQAPLMKGMMDQRGIVKTENKDGWYLVFEQPDRDNYKLTAVHEKVVIVISGAESEEILRNFLGNIKLQELEKAAQ